MITDLTILSGPASASPINTISLTLAQDVNTATITPSSGNGVTIPAATSGPSGLAGLLDSTRAGIIDALPTNVGDYNSLTNLPTLGWNPNFVIDGGGLAITTGVKYYFVIGVPITITGWALLANTSGSIAIDIWKAPSSLFPPTVANSIVAGVPPSLTSQQINFGGDIGGVPMTWSTKILNVNDIIALNVNSVSGISRLTLYLNGTHS